MSTTVVVLVVVTGVVGLGTLAYCAYRRYAKIRARRAGDLDSPLLRGDKDGKKEKKNKDPVISLLYNQVKELQDQKLRLDPEHSRLIQQDTVNRKIFEQLNNQQKHINEVINSQDKILREQMQKIDLIERQEECMIDKIDEFMRETIQEAAKEIHNETEYHHYRHRKLQQTLLQQTADRTAGLIDTAGMEKQINELRTMFQRTQDDRQKIVSTLSALQTQGPRYGPVEVGSMATGGNPLLQQQQQIQLQQQQLQLLQQQQQPVEQPISPTSTASPMNGDRPPINIGSLRSDPRLPTSPFKVQNPNSRKQTGSDKQDPLAPTFPYPYIKTDQDEDYGHAVVHGSPRGADVADGMKSYSMQSSTMMSMKVPPALRKKRAAERDKERNDGMYGGHSAGGEDDWWRGLMASKASPLRPENTFASLQRNADASVSRVEQSILGESKQGQTPDEPTDYVKPLSRASSYISSKRPSHTYDPPDATSLVDDDGEDDDDDLARTIPTAFTIKQLGA
eukprot:TRINITY_DN34162_c0_g1_i1.p1 TRINITY_DN34162_c0_g1~~TRINITY_DN34162_c0_g1_i1.p1  ORF type:complete len:507 (+),score=102.58 TRINITY_DN34162_c0_g1_i1:69-1589(+)